MKSTGGGSIAVNANNIQLSGGEFGGSSLRAGITEDSVDANAQAGNINLNATGTINLSGGSFLDNSTFGQGNAGKISIITDGAVNLANDSIIFNNVEQGGVGDSQGVIINAQSLSVADGSTIQTLVRGSTQDNPEFGQGDAGDMNINVRENASFSGFSVDEDGNPLFSSQASSNLGINAIGSAGNINITAASFSLSNQAILDSSTFGEGNAGQIKITTQDTVELATDSTIFNNVSSEAVGDGGNVEITTNNLSITNGATINADTFGQGNSGNVLVNANESITLNGVSPDGFSSRISNTVEFDAVGNAGNVEITTNNLSITDGATIDASTFGRGNSGNILVDASESITLDGTSAEGFGSGIFNTVGFDAEGNGGNVEITTNNLSIANGATINASTEAEGNSGNVLVNANELITLDGVSPNGQFGSGIFNTVGFGAVGNGGNVEITTNNLSIANGAAISASIFGQGNSGNVLVNSESITLSGISPDGQFGSGIFSQISSEGIGSTGEIIIDTSNLLVTNGSFISAETSGESNAGNLTINASELVEVKGLNSGLFSRTGGGGNSGTININTPELTIQNNAEVGVSNFIETELNVEPSGTTTRVVETGGGIIFEISPDGRIVPIEIEGKQIEFDVNLPANIERVRSFTQGTGDAGILNITANNIQLSDAGAITAISAGGKGGVINIKETDILTFQDNSNITATAAGFKNVGGDGGNINIDADLIVAYPRENNNITANAFGGKGGNINIDATGIFGIEERLILDDLTNDINASSESNVGGNININNRLDNAIQGAIQLSTNLVEPEQTTEQVCQADRETEAKNGLIVRGKGGIPPEPTEPLVSELINVNGEMTQAASPQPEAIEPIRTSKGNIIPAQGVEIREDGSFILTAYPTSNNSRIPQIPTSCGVNRK